jgi:hypothetical protein
MAPVAGGITNGKKNRFPLLFCPGKGLLSPGIPVHRVMGMLEQIWTLFMNQVICFFIHGTIYQGRGLKSRSRGK